MTISNNNQNLEACAGSSMKLCSGCSQFYGNQTTDFLCSKCYKERPVNEVKLPQMSKVLAAEEVKDQSSKSIEQIAEPIKEETPAKPAEKDHSRCFTCSKKVGLLGFKCPCESTFCRTHRMPEMHECVFDFGKVGRDRLSKENLVVKADKIIKF